MRLSMRLIIVEQCFPLRHCQPQTALAPLPQSLGRWASLPALAPCRTLCTSGASSVTTVPQTEAAFDCAANCEGHRRQKWDYSRRKSDKRATRQGLCFPVQVSRVGVALFSVVCSCVARGSEGWLQRPAPPLPWGLDPKADRRERRESEGWCQYAESMGVSCPLGRGERSCCSVTR